MPDDYIVGLRAQSLEPTRTSKHLAEQTRILISKYYKPDRLKNAGEHTLVTESIRNHGTLQHEASPMKKEQAARVRIMAAAALPRRWRRLPSLRHCGGSDGRGVATP